MSAGLTIAVLVELADGKPTQSGYELIAAARSCVQPDSGTPVSAIVLGRAEKDVLKSLIERGADRVYHAANEAFETYQPDTWLDALATVMEVSSAQLMLMGHTNIGGDLAPRLAFRTGGAIATGCESISMNGKDVMVTRPCYGNKARETVHLTAVPAIGTVRAKVFDGLDADAGRTGDIIDLNLDPAPSRIRVLNRTIEKSEGVQLESARVVVSGGRGLGGPAGFEVLQKLADELGGAVGASRVACDLGWCPHTWQVGLSGKTVSPDLYIAVGISGASHHMAGCGRSKAIVAINNDSEAPIFTDAKFGVVGDYKEIVDAMIEEVRKSRGDQPARRAV